MIEQCAIAVSDLVGVPFVSGGRDIDGGLDCWGLVMIVMARYGFTVPDFTVDAFAYKRIEELANGAIMGREWYEVFPPVEHPAVILLQVHPKYITHAAVYLDGDRFIHTTEKTGVVISDFRSPLNAMIRGFYKYAPHNKRT